MKATGLKTKIVILSTALSMIGLMTGLVGYLTLSSVAEKYHAVTYNDLPAVKILGDLRGQFRELRIHVRALAFEGLDQKNVDMYLSKALPEIAEIKKSFIEYKKLNSNIENKSNFAELEKAWDEFENFGGQIVALAQNYEQNHDQIVKLIKDVCPVKAEKFYKALSSETNYNLQMAKASVEIANTTENSGKNFIVLIALSVLFCSPVLAFLVSSRISRSIAQIAEQIEISGKEILHETEAMDSSSTQLSMASSQVTSSLEETVASLEEISSMVKRNSENAKEAATLSDASKRVAETGEYEIRNLIVAMREISKSSQKIEEIIELIDSIAFQTNLLALNAAVEAARAGEQGRGFAVVADAVRALAQKSAVAAKDISGLIGESVELVEKGCKMADRSGEALQQILSEVSKVSILNADIAAASQEQSTGIHQVSTAMSQIEEATHKNAQSAESISEAVKQLTQLSENAKELNSGLRTIIYGIEGHLTEPTTQKASTANVRPTVTERSHALNHEIVIPMGDFHSNSRENLGKAEGF